MIVAQKFFFANFIFFNFILKFKKKLLETC